MVKGSHQTEDAKRKVSEATKGRIAWNRGKTTSIETKKKLSESMRGNKNPLYGKHHSEESKRKMSLARGKYVEEIHPCWKGGKAKIPCKVCGYVVQVLARNGRAKFCSGNMDCKASEMLMKKKDTDIERLIENELIRRNIPYTKQVPLLGITIADFLLSKDTVIYADGDYWHNLPIYKKRDSNQAFILTFYGYRVLRFWGKEITGSAKKCIDRVIKK